MKKFGTALALLAAAIMAFAFLAWKCLRDPMINFLPGDQRAEWIIFPAPIDPRTHPVATIDATFRRNFTINSQPKTGRLEIRAAKRVDLKINEQSLPPIRVSNWKQMSILDVSRFLRGGENKIEARVFNNDAPPALWIFLTADLATLRADGNWEASIAGSSWRNCALASIPCKPGPGNLLAGGENIYEVLPRIWPTWILFAIVTALLIVAGARWLKPNADVDLSRREVFVLLGICALAWAALFWNNAKMLPFPSGYDFKDHVAYIKYIQDRGTLPLPNEGYEMFQPPLYYALSAGVLSIFRLSVSDQLSVTLLRAMTMLFGIANFVFVFLSLRLIFPRQRLLQIIGLLTAAFLPMQLYLSHYLTNETLAATLVSAAIYFALRVLRTGMMSPWLFLALGVVTGAAMLAKVTSLLLIPPLLGALLIRLARERAPIPQWFRAFGITVAAIFAIAGWYYARSWRQFGKPIVGNWEAVLGFPWWQDPGFHTSGDYFRFGRALFAPLFSGFNGFADGFYSTLWGDSLGGGLSGLLSRTPWNYSLFAGGYYLALIPTLLVLIGFGVAIYRFTRKPSPNWFLLIGFSATVAVALIFMTLRVPSYAQVKAFYGLAALVPLCCFLALGLETLTRRFRSLEIVLIALLVFFSINSFTSVWIRPSTEQHIYAALRFISEVRFDRAISEAEAAVKSKASSVNAHYLLAAVLDETGESDKAIAESKRGLELDPANGDCHLQLAITLAKQGQLSEAMSEAQRSIELLPENARARDLIFAIERAQHGRNEVGTAARDALAVSPFDPDLHYRVGLSLGELGDLASAVHQIAYAQLLAKHPAIESNLHIMLNLAAQRPNGHAQLVSMLADAPDSPMLLNELAWLFATHPNATVRDGAQAIRLSQRASDLTDAKQPRFLVAAAAAYAEANRFSEAIANAQEALALARSDGDSNTAELAERLLNLFQSNQAYREEPR